MSMSSTTTPGTGTTGSSSGTDESMLQHGTQVLKEHAGTTATTAKQEAASVVESATTHARSLLGTAGDELREQSRSQADRLRELLGQASEEFGRMAEQGDATTPAGRTVRTLADATGQLSRRLEEGGPDGVMSDVSGFARRRPGVFLAVSAAAGFAVGRLARSSDPKALKEAVQPSASGGQSGTGNPGSGALGAGASNGQTSAEPFPAAFPDDAPGATGGVPVMGAPVDPGSVIPPPLPGSTGLAGTPGAAGPTGGGAR
jgi:hypothetical protein